MTDKNDDDDDDGIRWPMFLYYECVIAIELHMQWTGTAGHTILHCNYYDVITLLPVHLKV